MITMIMVIIIHNGDNGKDNSKNYDIDYNDENDAQNDDTTINDVGNGKSSNCESSNDNVSHADGGNDIDNDVNC